MHAAVAKFFVVERHLFGAFASLLGDTGNGFTLFFALLNLLQHGFGHLRLLVQEVVEFFFDEVVDEFVDRRAVLIHQRASEFYFGLRFENRFHHFKANGSHHTRANVAIFEVFIEKLLDGAAHSFAESRLVSAALSGVLTVDKRIVFLAILVGVSDNHLYLVVLKMDRRVERVVAHIFLYEVAEAIARAIFLAVVDYGKSRVEERVVFNHNLHGVVAEREVAENGVVGFEANQSAVFGVVGSRSDAAFFHHLTACKRGVSRHAIAHRLHEATFAKGIGGFEAHAIHTHRTLVVLSIEFTAGVHGSGGTSHVLQRNAATIVANGHLIVVDCYLNGVAKTGSMFVDSIVEGLFEEDVDAVVAL